MELVTNTTSLGQEVKKSTSIIEVTVATGGREERKNNKVKILDIKVKILDIKNLN